VAFLASASNATAVPMFADNEKQAAFISPLEDWNPTWHTEEYVSLLENAGYHVDFVLGENASISFLKTRLGDYDLIILRTDSFTYEGNNFYCSGEAATFEARKTYANEIEDGQIQVAACVGFNALLISNSYPAGSLRRGLVTVLDGYSADLGQAFIEAGEAAFVGYYDDAYSLSWGRLDALSLQWLKYASQGYSIKESVLMLYGYLNRGHGETASWPALFYYGEAEFKI